ncbi:MAG: cytochrome c/FTR1 family iron permease [Myxococcaceae bacterium]|nr:cytochrome c/FTR1 family iron permease [Myxococcaceae bacterium]
MLMMSVLALCAQVGAAQTPPSAEPEGEAQSSWHHVVGILQYLQADYPEALKSGSPTEMEEQRAFVQEAITTAQEIGPAARAFVPRMKDIQKRIDAGQDPEGVSRDCAALIEDLVLAGGLARSPHQVPELARGRELFAQACAACHGTTGDGQAPAAATMDPKPANFLDPRVMASLTPYKAFNTISFGVTGTAMPSFSTALTEKDRWALAFYVVSLRHRGATCQGEPAPVSLEKLATESDEALAAEYGVDAVPCLRTRPPKPDDEALLLSARTHVLEAMAHAKAGDPSAAKQALLTAYLAGVEPVEPLLRARSPGLVAEIEQAVLRMRVAIDQRSPHVKDEGRELISLIDRARRSGGKTTVLGVALMAFVILLREGFEALVVIAALLAVLKRMKAEQQARVVHAGWATALVAGGVAFIFGQQLLTGANREWVEGVVALIAVGMLLYAALWLNARANMSAFMKELRGRMEGALGGGSLIGLFFISFSAVGRETFETALFLQGLSIDSSAGTVYGALAGLLCLTGLVILVSRVGYRLPMKLLFNISTGVLFATAVMLLGKGLHALQEVGAVPIAPIPMIRVDVLGVFPDAYSLVPQLLLALSPLAWSGVKKLRGRSATRASGAVSGTPH